MGFVFGKNVRNCIDKLQEIPSRTFNFKMPVTDLFIYTIFKTGKMYKVKSNKYYISNDPL